MSSRFGSCPTATLRSDEFTEQKYIHKIKLGVCNSSVKKQKFIRIYDKSSVAT